MQVEEKCGFIYVDLPDQQEDSDDWLLPGYDPFAHTKIKNYINCLLYHLQQVHQQARFWLCN